MSRGSISQIISKSFLKLKTWRNLIKALDSSQKRMQAWKRNLHRQSSTWSKLIMNCGRRSRKDKLISLTRHRAIIVVVDLLGNLPNLNNVVFCYWGNHISFVGVPRKICNLSSMSSVHKHHFRRSVLLFFFSLVCSNLRNIPNDWSSVSWSRGEEVFMVRMVLNNIDLFWVLLEEVDCTFEVSSIPHSYSLITRTCEHEVGVVVWEVDANRFFSVSVYWRNTLALSSVPDFEFLVVTNRSEQMLVLLMPSNVFNNWFVLWILVKLASNWRLFVEIPSEDLEIRNKNLRLYRQIPREGYLRA